MLPRGPALRSGLEVAPRRQGESAWGMSSAGGSQLGATLRESPRACCRTGIPAVHLAEYPTRLARRVLAVCSGQSEGLRPALEPRGVRDPGTPGCRFPGDCVRFPEKGESVLPGISRGARGGGFVPEWPGPGPGRWAFGGGLSNWFCQNALRDVIREGCLRLRLLLIRFPWRDVSGAPVHQRPAPPLGPSWSASGSMQRRGSGGCCRCLQPDVIHPGTGRGVGQGDDLEGSVVLGAYRSLDHGAARVVDSGNCRGRLVRRVDLVGEPVGGSWVRLTLIQSSSRLLPLSW